MSFNELRELLVPSALKFDAYTNFAEYLEIEILEEFYESGYFKLWKSGSG